MALWQLTYGFDSVRHGQLQKSTRIHIREALLRLATSAEERRDCAGEGHEAKDSTSTRGTLRSIRILVYVLATSTVGKLTGFFRLFPLRSCRDVRLIQSNHKPLLLQLI